MNYNHKTILKVYPNAAMIDDDIGVFDNDGNQIEIDVELVESATIEILEEENWEYLRNIRNRFLSETDWVSSKYYDLGQPVPTEWVSYRQALRDLPANTEDPANPTWPTKPS